MGNFGGHALPGSFFFAFALWWTIQIYSRYWSSKRSGGKFTSSASFTASFMCGRFKDFPIEAAFKIFCVTVGVGLEIYTGMRGGKFVGIGNAQHATMFFFFGLTGVMDLLVYYKAPIPPDMQYISLALAFCIEGLLFHFHLHGRPPLDVLIHTLLVYVIVGNVLAVIIGMRYRQSLLASLARCYFTFLQGTWFYQIGFILYSPSNTGNSIWDENDNDSLIVAAFVFAWHCGIILIMMLILGAIISFFYRKSAYGRFENDASLHRLIRTDPHGQPVVSVDDDGDSDIEFDKPALLTK